MKIIFFGTSELAVAALRALCSKSKHKILAVVTAADKGKGRGQRLSFSPVKVFAQKSGLLILQPEDLGNRRFVQFLQGAGADLFVVCAYGKLLSKELLQIPRLYSINLHTSLLPKYRGAAPINWTIIRGEKESGVTILKMNEFMDQGEIILQEKTEVASGDTAEGLAERLAQIGARVLLASLNLIEQGRATFRAQDETRASLAPKLKKEDGLISWQSSALEIYNRIRGLQPWPGAFTYLEDKILKIRQSQVVAGKGKNKQGSRLEPGELVEVDSKRGILVQTGKGRLLLTMLQLEGKRSMSAGEFILGHRIKTGEKLGKRR